MARLWMGGAEIDVSTSGGPDGVVSGTGTATRDTTVFRSGVASYKLDSTASGLSVQVATQPAIVFADTTSYYFRAYVRVVAAPTTAAPIITFGSGVNDPAIRLRTDGAVELFGASVAHGSPSASIADSTWHRVELIGNTTTTNWLSAQMRVDGVQIASWSPISLARSGGATAFGWCTIGPGPGTSQIINFDDVAVNDDGGAANNNVAGAGAVVLLKPTADSAVGTGWTLGTGTVISGDSGKTAVSNTPPLGVADLAAGSDVKQIRNATSNANVNYDATMTTYAAAGVGSSDTVKAVQCWAATAAPLVTSAKLGTVGIVSNPAVANVNLGAGGTAGAFWSGVAGGTYATGWKWSPGTMTQAPTVTTGTAPVMRVTQVTASTRIAVVCGMFIYVDYTPAPAAIPDVGMALTVT